MFFCRFRLLDFSAADRKQTVGYLQFTQPNRGVSCVWERRMWTFLNAGRAVLCVDVASSETDHLLSLVVFFNGEIPNTSTELTCTNTLLSWSEGPFGLNVSLVGDIRRIYPSRIWHIDPKASRSETAKQSTFGELTRCDERSPPGAPLLDPPLPHPLPLSLLLYER